MVTPSLVLRVRPSRRLLAIVLAAHLGASLCLVPLALPWWVKALVLVAVVTSAGSHARRDALLWAPDSVVELRLLPDGAALVTRDGRTLAARLRATLIHPYATVLRAQLSSARRPRPIVLLADAVEPEPHRRLRVLLRAGADARHPARSAQVPERRNR